MNKTIRNYLLDMALFLLLAVDIASLAGRQAEASSVAMTSHIVSSVLLALGSLVHIIWHFGWIRAVLAGRVKDRIRCRIKFGMNSMVTLMIALAASSGFAALVSDPMDRFHGTVGSVALLGLFIHSVKHLRWMFATSRKLFSGNLQQQAGEPA
jgi:hypothetical protein